MMDARLRAKKFVEDFFRLEELESTVAFKDTLEMYVTELLDENNDERDGTLIVWKKRQQTDNDAPT
jgi:hypothetical protein